MPRHELVETAVFLVLVQKS